MATTKATANLKNPKGGLTDAGRRHYAKTEGAHLKAGVTGTPKSAEEMRRKGSFLTRFYGRSKPHPLTDKDGKPSRYALAAHAWGEPVPKSLAAVHKLAKKGERLLQRAKSAKAPKAKAASRRQSRSVSAGGKRKTRGSAK